MDNALMFSKASDEWRTPQDFFEALDAEFGFDVDMAASAENCWKENYWGLDHPRTDRRNSLVFDWGLPGTICWLNPPYSKCREFIAKAAEQAARGCTVVCLVPSRTDTRWWHEHVWDRHRNATRPGVEVRFVKSRLKFGTQEGPIRTSLRNGPGSQPNNCAPFPSVVIVFRPLLAVEGV